MNPQPSESSSKMDAISPYVADASTALLLSSRLRFPPNVRADVRIRSERGSDSAPSAFVSAEVFLFGLRCDSVGDRDLVRKLETGRSKNSVCVALFVAGAAVGSPLLSSLLLPSLTSFVWPPEPPSSN